MGMDVFGKNPANKVGEYFRRNVWGWRPLWDYVMEQHPELGELVKHGYSNDGDGLNKQNSLLLAKKLEDDLQTGSAQKYIQARNERLASLPLEDCKYCEATGVRSDEVGVENGMPDRELREEQRIVLGRDKGWCNGCDGVGQVQSFFCSYYLDTEDIEEFAQFLKACGGFEIC